MIGIRTPENVMRHFGCDYESAQRYIDLRAEGYSGFTAAIMAGLADPPDHEAPERSDSGSTISGRGE